MTRVPAFALVFVAACFNPTYHNPTCGPNGECPSGTTCVDGTCRAPGSMDDAAIDDAALDDSGAMLDAVPDAAPDCVGSGAWQMCAAAEVVTTPTTLTGTLNTDTASACVTTVDWTSAAQPDACIVAGTSITISGSVVVSGTRPLVLFATGTITLQSGATLDVASHRAQPTTGPGKQPAGCVLGTLPMDSTGGAGGAAGGSFISKGGLGGAGGNAATAGSPANADTAAPTVLRGGCRGQQGGMGEQGAGTFGQGGGAVYLVAGTSISLAGTVNASGAAGGGGGKASGGGGGGTGGMIVLSAPSITSSGAKLLANGGGGGGGGGGTNGQPGFEADPANPTVVANGGMGGSGNGCAGTAKGGAGAASATSAADGTNGVLASICGGGGGGGGGGYIQANVAISGSTVSPALSVVP